MGAILIAVNSWTRTDGSYNTTAVAMNINTHYILSVRTKTTAYLTTGVTEIIYAWPVNSTMTQATLIITQTAAAILTASNANVIAT